MCKASINEQPPTAAAAAEGIRILRAASVFSTRLASDRLSQLRDVAIAAGPDGTAQSVRFRRT
jgi:hypothetical protein